MKNEASATKAAGYGEDVARAIKRGRENCHEYDVELIVLCARLAWREAVAVLEHADA